MSDAKLTMLRELEKLRLGHHECEDTWYSCPKSRDGCADDSQVEGVCNCGADDRNARLDNLITLIKESL